ncbi:MAG: hypothetical protein HFF02_02200 [Erysipelotrichaceae bacterium]|nr:hypothetical protein [Erysipelotrichaceae bacterium]
MKQAQFSSVFSAAIGAFFLYLAFEQGFLDGNSILMGSTGLLLILIGSLRYRILKKTLHDIHEDHKD